MWDHHHRHHHHHHHHQNHNHETGRERPCKYSGNTEGLAWPGGSSNHPTHSPGWSLNSVFLRAFQLLSRERPDCHTLPICRLSTSENENFHSYLKLPDGLLFSFKFHLSFVGEWWLLKKMLDASGSMHQLAAKKEACSCLCYESDRPCQDP